jgi:signal transduction histidine kinase
MARPQINTKLSDLTYKSIIDCLPCYLSIQDRSLNIIFVNQTFIRDFGEGVGKLCHQIYKGSPEKCPSCPVQKTFQDKQHHLSEETVQLSNGKVCQLIVHSAPILDIYGRIEAVIELATNVTQIKESHKELIFLGQSLAFVSHGIKNILEGLEGGAYVVEEGIQSRDMKLAGKGWAIVKKNIIDISSVVQNILYASKRRTLRLQNVSPGDLVREVVERYREKAAASGVELAVQVNPALPATSLDASSVRKLLNNLVLNALEACEKEAHKVPRRVTVRADTYDKWHFQFEVADNGIGMDETTRRNIFKEFFSTKGSEGTGLGLAVVEKVVKEHGGKIEVLTQPGEGSTFRVILKKR